MACETQAAIIELVDGDQESRMGDVERRSKLATASSIIIGSRSRVTEKATASTKHNHMGMFGKTN
jgi:hypothetical protein